MIPIQRCLSCFVTLLAASAAPASPVERPNIVFILSDDQDWTGLSVQMHPDVPNSKSDFYRTPHLERFAAQGMRFSAAYSPAPVCSPTRISLQTGMSPAKLGWTKAAPAEAGHKLIEGFNRNSIRAEEVTLAEMLKTAGYATAHYGKWHLSGGGPEAHGYDASDGDTGNRDADAHIDPNPVDIFGMTERAAAFLEKESRAGKPCFVQMSYYALHLPENALQATRAFYESQPPGAMHSDPARAAITTDLDTGVGRLLSSIDRLGLAGKTYVIYMSDNGAGGGGKGGARPLSAGKGGVWEGGIRVPLLVRGPGIAANSWCHQRVVGYDWFPTICRWAGVKEPLPAGLEGGDLTPLLFEGSREPVRRAREELVFHFPHYQGDTPHSAILRGNHKLLHFYETGATRLFDLGNDLAERNDLSASQPKVAADLKQRLDGYLAAVGASLPKPNPDYDPANEPTGKGGKGGGGKGGGKGGMGKGRSAMSEEDGGGEAPAPAAPAAPMEQPIPFREGGGGGGGSSPLLLAIDRDGDRELSLEEMREAGKALLSLDTDQSGQLEPGEIAAAASRGPGPGDRSGQARQPWMLVHAAELDADGDGVVSFEGELMPEANRVFDGYDRNRDGQIDARESGPEAAMVRSALGGFVKEHPAELDRDGSGGISREELTGIFAKFFREADANGDQKLTSDESATRGAETSRDKGAMGTAAPRAGAAPARAQPGSWITVRAGELDLNGDGSVGRTELMDQARSAFNAFDGNGDGVLTAEEHSGRQPKSPVAAYLTENAAAVDGDGNGALTAGEFAAALGREFAAADRNQDGQVGAADTASTNPEPPAPAKSAPAPQRPAADRPSRNGPSNVVLFLIDDMGWRDLGFAGNRFIDTPNCDRLAREGMVFTQAYSSAPNCAPTRACLMSGQYTPRHGVYTVVDERHLPGSPHHKVLAAESRAELPTESVTLAESLRAGGYATGMMGMWNLGRGNQGPTTPTGQGFEVFKDPRSLGFEKDAYHRADGAYLTDEFTAAGIEWMEANRERPFFLYMAYHAVHAPYDPKPELADKYRRKAAELGEDIDIAHAATVEALDQNVGRILAWLDEQRLADRTLVLFTSDNGGTRQSTAPLNSGKGSLYEGGIRVPFAVRGPGIRAGQVSAEPVLSMDIYPTLLEFAGLPKPDSHRLDGVSLAARLTGTGGSLGRERVFWHFPCYVGGGSPSSAMRQGDWKVIEFFETQTVELYNLAQDPGEQNDLSGTMPDHARELAAALHAWQEETRAPRPTAANPDFDSSAPPNRGKGGGGGAERRGG